MSNKKFRVQIKEEFGKPALRITNNGFQWTSILLRDPIYEIPLIIDELQRYLTGTMHSDSEGQCTCYTFPYNHCPVHSKYSKPNRRR